MCYWLVRTYTPDAPRGGAAWQNERVPYPAGEDSAPRQELEALEEKLAEQNARTLKQQQERDALDSELQKVREQLAAIRSRAEAAPDPHDYTEAETRSWLIDVELKRAGRPLDQARDREYEVSGMPNKQGVGYADYVLWSENGKLLAVVEAKKTTTDSRPCNPGCCLMQRRANGNWNARQESCRRFSGTERVCSGSVQCLCRLNLLHHFSSP